MVALLTEEGKRSFSISSIFSVESAASLSAESEEVEGDSWEEEDM